MKVTLEREEVLACVIALERERKPGEWSKSALKKLDKALKRKAREEPSIGKHAFGMHTGCKWK